MSTLPNHHIPESVLLEYAAATLSEAVALVVGTHLALCPRCRELSSDYDALGGALMDSGEAQVSDGVLEAILGKLDETPATPTPRPVAYNGVIPQPLRDYTGPFDAIKWNLVAPGIWKLPLPVYSNGRQGALVHLRGGMRIPVHEHLGTERTLVLAGGFTDELSQFVRGDICVRAQGDGVHKQVIDRGEPCIALALDDDTKRMKSTFGRVISRLFDA